MHNSIFCLDVVVLLLHACISLKFQSAGFEKSDTITKAVDALKSDRRRQGSESERASRGSAGFGVVSSRASKAKISGGLQPRAWPCLFKLPAFTELLIGQAGLSPDELSGRSQNIHGRLCESSSTWLGRQEKQQGRSGGRKEWQGGRQKNPRPCVSKAQLIHC